VRPSLRDVYRLVQSSSEVRLRTAKRGPVSVGRPNGVDDPEGCIPLQDSGRLKADEEVVEAAAQTRRRPENFITSRICRRNSDGSNAATVCRRLGHHRDARRLTQAWASSCRTLHTTRPARRRSSPVTTFSCRGSCHRWMPTTAKHPDEPGETRRSRVSAVRSSASADSTGRQRPVLPRLRPHALRVG